MRKIIITIMVVLLCYVPVLAETKTIKASFNNINVSFDEEPIDINTILVSGTTYVPLRQICEYMDATVIYDPSNNSTRITMNTTTNNKVVYSDPALPVTKNGDFEYIDVVNKRMDIRVDDKELFGSYFMYQDRVYIALRMISERLGGVVKYNDATKTAYVYGTNEIAIHNMLNNINEFRTANNVGTLEMSNTVNNIAYINNIGMDLLGSLPYTCTVYGSQANALDAFDVQFHAQSQLVGNGVISTEKMFNSFSTGSATQILLNPNYNYVGINRYNENNKDYWSIIFLKSDGIEDFHPDRITNRNIMEIAYRTNIERYKSGISYLTLEKDITNAAMYKAKDMVNNNYFEHTSPNGQTHNDLLRMYKVSNVSYTGENIAYGFSTPSEVMDGWMDSPPHKKAILNPKYKKIGVGYYKDYWAQLFTN